MLAVGTPALAQQEPSLEDRVQSFIEAAKENAASVNARYEGLIDKIRKAQDSDTVRAELEDLSSQAELAARRYGKDSDLWKDYEKLVAFLEERKAYALDKLEATGNDRWQQSYDEYQALGRRLQDVRVLILKEAVRADALAKDFSAEIDWITDILVRKGVDAAVSEIEAAYADLKSLNDNLEAALDEAAKSVAGPSTGD
ncbi:MAG: hypothetical protein D6754_04290 [Alphaproteobacteria bacterium]|nr:MAG: hypothetical protein D6754_04290 [Alphaproteobacteria bacterium]